jgi:Bestrophin, RFP-TM, chloride channel
MATPSPESPSVSLGNPHVDTNYPTTADHLEPYSPGRNADFKPAPLRAPTHTSIELDDYFKGPRDIRHHSKVPIFLRIHGSVLPKMILPLLFVGMWATAITTVSQYVYNLSVNSVLLTVLGFVVGLALSFRSSTAYGEYLPPSNLVSTKEKLPKPSVSHSSKPQTFPTQAC